MSANDWLRYANQGATRNQPLDPRLVQAMGFLPELGVAMEVFSGGQPGQGSGGARVGSTRHDHGNAADVFFHRGDERLDWANPQHQPIFQDIVKRAKAQGVTGFGAGQGYMQPGSMHIGFGNPGVWGAGGKAASAPDWLVEAFGGAPMGNVAAAAPAAGPALSFGGAAPAPLAADPLAALFGGQMGDLAMGVPMAPAAAAPRAKQQAAQREDADMQRRQALFADVGSWFS